ncbi:hypothetical protein HanPI659440_Chr14g0570281 [Helianthus annuus]|nr:hypothetical protein HanPI659440_Chr14g0570281 [Helianthus annuus]
MITKTIKKRCSVIGKTEVTTIIKKGNRSINKKTKQATCPQNKPWEAKAISNRLREVPKGISN